VKLPRVSLGERLFSIDDWRAGFRHLPIELDIAKPPLRYVVFIENRVDRAFDLASVAVYALVGCDI
jgi:hypothetical protein